MIIGHKDIAVGKFTIIFDFIHNLSLKILLKLFIMKITLNPPRINGFLFFKSILIN